MRIRLVQKPSVHDVDGITLDGFEVGRAYEVGNSLGALFLAEGWAEPVPLDEPLPPLPFSDKDPDAPIVIDRTSPPNLVKETYPPSLDLIAWSADFKLRQRRRKPR